MYSFAIVYTSSHNISFTRQHDSKNEICTRQLRASSFPLNLTPQRNNRRRIFAARRRHDRWTWKQRETRKFAGGRKSACTRLLRNFVGKTWSWHARVSRAFDRLPLRTPWKMQSGCISSITMSHIMRLRLPFHRHHHHQSPRTLPAASIVLIDQTNLSKLAIEKTERTRRSFSLDTI